MDDTVKDDDEFRPEVLAGLVATKYGSGPEGRLQFVERATETFGYVSPRALEHMWNEAVNRLKGEGA